MSGILPWWRNKWREFQHDPENNGKSVSHYAGTPKDYKADQRVFKCYSSTATGEHSSTKTRDNIFKDPKLRVIAFVIFCCISYAVYSVFFGSSAISIKHDKTTLDSVPVPVPVPAVPDLGNGSGHGSHHQNDVKSVSIDSPPPKRSFLTPDDIIKWSIQGVEPDMLLQMPVMCTVISIV